MNGLNLGPGYQMWPKSEPRLCLNWQLPSSGSTLHPFNTFLSSWKVLQLQFNPWQERWKPSNRNEHMVYGKPNSFTCRLQTERYQTLHKPPEYNRVKSNCISISKILSMNSLPKCGYKSTTYELSCFEAGPKLWYPAFNQMPAMGWLNLAKSL